MIGKIDCLKGEVGLRGRGRGICKKFDGGLVTRSTVTSLWTAFHLGYDANKEKVENCTLKPLARYL